MADVPTGKMDFETLYALKASDTNAVLDYCLKVGLIPNERKCKFCTNNMRLISQTGSREGKMWLCTGRLNGVMHRVRESLRKGTWFENSKLSLIEILIITFMWCGRFTSEQIQTHGKVGQQAVTDWMISCRDVCVEFCLNNNEQIGGKGKIIELYECGFGEKSLKKNKQGTWLYAGLDKSIKGCFYVVVNGQSKDNLLKIVKDYVLPGTTISSECWKTHKCLKDKDFLNQKTSREINFLVPMAGSAGGSWGGLKRYLRGQNLSKSELHSYIAEYFCRSILDKECFFEEFCKEVVHLYEQYDSDEDSDDESFDS